MPPKLLPDFSLLLNCMKLQFPLTPVSVIFEFTWKKDTPVCKKKVDKNIRKNAESKATD